MINVYEVSTNGELRSTDATEFPSTAVTDGVVRWVRMVGPEAREQLPGVYRALALPDAVVEQYEEGDIRSWVVVHERAVLVTLPALVPGEESPSVLRVICSATTLITVEPNAFPAIDKLVAERASVARPDLTPVGLSLEVIEVVTFGAAELYRPLRHKLEDLAEAVEDHPLDVPPHDLLDMKRRVGQVSMLWEDQMHVFMELARHPSQISTAKGADGYLRGLAADMDRGLKLLSQMEARLRDLRQHQLQCLQESTNRRLNMLTILSAVYLPATLIAGIYGMNFENIPITQIPFGYFIVLALMVGVVVGQLWLFRRWGWFR